MKKDLKYYMNLPYSFELVPDPYEGGYTVIFPDLPGCLTVGRTLEEAYENAEDAKKVWLEATLEEGMEVPLPSRMSNYSGQFKLRIPKTLHRDLARHARREGISMNQYCLYLLSRNDALEAG